MRRDQQSLCVLRLVAFALGPSAWPWRGRYSVNQRGSYALQGAPRPWAQSRALTSCSAPRPGCCAAQRFGLVSTPCVSHGSSWSAMDGARILPLLCSTLIFPVCPHCPWPSSFKGCPVTLDACHVGPWRLCDDSVGFGNACRPRLETHRSNSQLMIKEPGWAPVPALPTRPQHWCGSRLPSPSHTTTFKRAVLMAPSWAWTRRIRPSDSCPQKSPAGCEKGLCLVDNFGHADGGKGAKK